MPEGPIQSRSSQPTTATRPNKVPPGDTGASPTSQKPASETAKETVISVIIAFAIAFVFRGFVVEAFVIPTGSMAPTLLGQHMRFHDRDSGYDWAVSPWQYRKSIDDPEPIQKNISVHDPMSGANHQKTAVSIRTGDRILVLKYLYALMEPERFDVVVFKNPAATDPNLPPRPTDNYIKRLIGLPGEQIALVDGDVFVRHPDPAKAKEEASDSAKFWELPGWEIARKNTLTQQSVWQTVFDSSFAPVPAPTWFKQPWSSVDPGWDFDAARYYEYSGETPTTLIFDQTQLRFNDPATRSDRRDTWRITDRYAYDEIGSNPVDPWQKNVYPVSDVRIRAGVEPRSGSEQDLAVEIRLQARGHEFALKIQGSQATLTMLEPVGPAGIRPAATSAKSLGTSTIEPLKSGQVTNIELWHADQSLRVYIDDKLAIGPVNLDWTIAQRLKFATGRDLSDLTGEQDRRWDSSNILASPELYSKPEISWTFSGPVRLYRAAVDRDLYYRPMDRVQTGLLATSPYTPLTLNKDQFFFCGDNSPQSHDGRAWGYPDPWIALEFGNHPGVVPRELILGKAFFVYWPSLMSDRGPIPVPDFGRMRMIW